MHQSKSPLDHINVASPCPADWKRMTGDDRVRFCGQCQLSVYNLSGMTRDEAEALVNQHEGRLCVRFFRREDGTMLTKDCPVGLRALHQQHIRRLSNLTGKAAAVTLITAIGVFTVASPVQSESPHPHQPVMGDIMGEVASPVQGTPALPRRTPSDDMPPSKKGCPVKKQPEHPVIMGKIAPPKPTPENTPKHTNDKSGN